MAWTFLIIAGLLEIGWAIGLKYSQGFTHPIASIVTLATMGASMYLLALAARDLPIGTAYAVWVGIGAFGTAVLGIALFGEARDPVRLICLAMIVAGVVGLKTFSKV